MKYDKSTKGGNGSIAMVAPGTKTFEQSYKLLNETFPGHEMDPRYTFEHGLAKPGKNRMIMVSKIQNGKVIATATGAYIESTDKKSGFGWKEYAAADKKSRGRGHGKETAAALEEAMRIEARKRGQIYKGTFTHAEDKGLNPSSLYHTSDKLARKGYKSAGIFMDPQSNGRVTPYRFMYKTGKEPVGKDDLKQILNSVKDYYIPGDEKVAPKQRNTVEKAFDMMKNTITDVARPVMH